MSSHRYRAVIILKKFNRSVRRHHTERLKKNRSHYYGGIPKRVSFYVNTPTPCSCHMCGNPRKWWKSKTLKEEIFLVEDV